MTTIEPFPLIDLSGPPEARGRAYGRAAKARVHRSLGHYGAQLAASGQEVAQVRAMARAFVPKIDAFDPAYVAEMRGIAEGADAAFEDIVLVNCRTEVLQLARRAATAAAATRAAPDGCTGAIILPEASADGTLIHGQNWDWKPDCAETGVVLRIRRDDGPDILTFVEAGGLARSGLNGAGIGLTANYLESDRDYRQQGVPLSLLRRKALEQEHVAMALQVLHATPKSASNNLMLSQGGFGIDIECAPDESFLLHAEGGIVVHANHFLSPAALAKLRDTGLAGTPCSVTRERRVRAALEAKRGRLSFEDLRAAFFDDWQSPWSVCRPPRMALNGAMSATVAMILMRPAEGVMEVAPMPALQRRFTRYALAPQPAAAAAAAQAVAAE